MLLSKLFLPLLRVAGRSNRTCPRILSVFNNNSNGRNISSSAIFNCKLFQQTENIYAHNSMRGKGAKYKLAEVFKAPKSPISTERYEDILEQDWSISSTPSELVSTFELLSNYAYHNQVDIQLNCFDRFIDVLTDNMINMTDEELKSICSNLLKWPETKSAHSRNYVEIWAALDDVLCERIEKWDFDEMLLFADYVHHLYLVRKVDFTRKALLRLARRAPKLTPEQLVQTMFYLATYRNNLKYAMDFELRFIDLIDSLSLEEIGIISMGFFKTKSSLKNVDFVNKILDRVIAEAKTVNEFTLSAILKVIRASSQFQNNDHITRMLDSLIPRIDDLSLVCCLQIALVGSRTSVCHRESLEAIAQKFVNDPSKARFKDLERLSFVLSEFNFEPRTTRPIFNTILDEFRQPYRADELNAHGKSFVRTLAFLTVFNIYPLDLLDKAQSKEFIENAYTKDLIYKKLEAKGELSPRELITLKYSIDIECNNYNGNILDTRTSAILVHKLSAYIPKPDEDYSLSSIDKQILEMILLLRKLRGGEDYVYTGHILPHYHRPDIIICNDVKNNPLKVAQCFPSSKHPVVHRTPDNVNKWFAFVFNGRYSMVADCKELLGPTIMKLRQLQKLGFKPLVIQFQGWRDLRNEEQKIIYVNNLIRQQSNDGEESYAMSKI